MFDAAAAANLIASLKIMGLGMGGIFAVMLIIMSLPCWDDSGRMRRSRPANRRDEKRGVPQDALFLWLRQNFLRSMVKSKKSV